MVRRLGVAVVVLLAGATSAQTVAPRRTEQARMLLSEASRLARGLAAPSLHLGYIADLQAAAGDVDGVRETGQAPDGTLHSIALRRTGLAQARAGDVPAALATARSITLEHHRADVLAEVAVAEAVRGDVAAAEATLRRLPRFYRREALARVAKAQAAQGEIQAALRTIERIGTRGDQARFAASAALADVATAQARAGDPTAAERTFARATALAEEVVRGPTIKTGASPQASALETVAVAQARLGMTASAERTTDRIALAEFRVDGLLAVARTAREAGRDDASATLARAVELARRLPASVSRNIALERAARAALAFGDLDTARALAPLPGLPWSQVTILAEVAIVEAGTTGIETARATLARARAVADTMPNDYRKSFAFADISRASARIGDVEEALKAGQSIDDARSRAAMAGRIARDRIDAADVDGALAALAALPRVERASALTGLVMVTVKNDRADLASRLLREIPAASAAYARAVRAVAAKRAERGDVEMAAEFAAPEMPLEVRVGVLVGTAAGLLGRTADLLDDP